MKILSFSVYSYPESVAGSHLGQNINQAFAQAGFEMISHVPMPSRGITNKQRTEYKKKRIEKLNNGHRTIYRFKMFKEGKNSLQRTLRYFICNVIQFFLGSFTKKVDVIFASSTPPTQGATAALVKKVLRKPFIYNLQDIFPDSMVGTGLTRKGSLVFRIGRIIENFTYRNADKIIVISEDFKQNILAKGVPENKIEVIYNWVDENAVFPVSVEDNTLINELQIEPSKFNVVYAGNLGLAQNVDIIIDAAYKLKEVQDINFIIFGTGGVENELKEKVKKLGLKNVKIYPLQPYEKVSYVYSLADVSIVSCKKGLGGSAMPSKTWNIMATGTAVLANFDEDTELQRIIEREQVGVFSKSGDTKAFINATMVLYNDRNKCAEYGKNAREYIINNLTRSVGTSKYIGVIHSVVSKV